MRVWKSSSCLLTAHDTLAGDLMNGYVIPMSELQAASKRKKDHGLARYLDVLLGCKFQGAYTAHNTGNSDD